MKRNLVAMMVVVAGTMFGQYGRPGAYDPGPAGYDDRYAYDDQGYVAPAPPPMPAAPYGSSYGYYRRPPMPGPGFVWVDGYWSWMRGRYAWVPGYWMRPPFAGGYWMAPRHDRGRFFAGFWARPGFGVGFGFGGGGRGNGHGYDRDRDRGRGGHYRR